MSDTPARREAKAISALAEHPSPAAADVIAAAREVQDARAAQGRPARLQDIVFELMLDHVWTGRGEA